MRRKMLHISDAMTIHHVLDLLSKVTTLHEINIISHYRKYS